MIKEVEHCHLLRGGVTMNFCMVRTKFVPALRDEGERFESAIFHFHIFAGKLPRKQVFFCCCDRELLKDIFQVEKVQKLKIAKR
jgi:hypothetical protein